MDTRRLLDIVEKFKDQRILVIGDIILDEYFFCEVERISREAPVPIAKINRKKHVLGGAANVANNLRALNVNVDLIGVAGNDANADILYSVLQRDGISTENIIKDKDRPTTIKTRILSSHQQLLRIDMEEEQEISNEVEEKIIEIVNKHISKYNVIILSDYKKGVLSKNLSHRVIDIANKYKVKVLVDPMPSTISHYKNAYLIKPNKNEAEDSAGVKFKENYENADEIHQKIKNVTNGANLIVTLGKDGMIIFDSKEEVRIPTEASEVFDVSGAGDTVISAISASIAAGSDLVEAAIIGNKCASIVLKKIGTATCSHKELVSEINKGIDYEPVRIKRRLVEVLKKTISLNNF